MVLHTISKTSAMDKCAPLISKGDTVVLLENGVFLILSPATDDTGVRWLALEADVQARGLAGRLPDHITLIDYDGFVEVTASADKTCNWF